MTAELAVPASEHAEVWDAVTDWLDKMFAIGHNNHRCVYDLENNIDLMSSELGQMDMEINHGSLTPSEQISSFRLTLRYRDMHDVLDRKWAAPAVKASAERAMQGIHERFLGPIPAAKQRTVIFTTVLDFSDTHLYSYVKAHRIEREPRWCRSATGRAVMLMVVEAPQWVHDIYRHLTGASLRGAALRAHYPAPRGSSWEHGGHVVSPPIKKPEPEVIETALRLWEPDDCESPYARIENAFEAAALL